MRKLSGQIIATSNDLTPNGSKWWFSKGIPFISGKSRLVKYDSICPDLWMCKWFLVGDPSMEILMHRLNPGWIRGPGELLHYLQVSNDKKRLPWLFRVFFWGRLYKLKPVMWELFHKPLIMIPIKQPVFHGKVRGFFRGSSYNLVYYTLEASMSTFCNTQSANQINIGPPSSIGTKSGLTFDQASLHTKTYVQTKIKALGTCLFSHPNIICMIS